MLYGIVLQCRIFVLCSIHICVLYTYDGIVMSWLEKQSLLSTKCKDWDSFLSFCSKDKEILHKLTKGNSISAKDDIFLKVYSSIAIEAKELQTEVKGFQRDMNIMYSETIKLIHADFVFQTTGDHLFDSTKQSSAMAIVRR